MTGCEAYAYLLNNLRHLGAIKWHSNTTSFYIKFRDIRIGSVRLSNHNSGERYNYTYEYKSDKNYFEIEVLDEMVDKIHRKVLDLPNFNPNNYVIYQKDNYFITNKVNYVESVRTRKRVQVSQALFS